MKIEIEIDLNELAKNEAFRTKDINDYDKRRLYPSESEPQHNQFNFEKDHLHSTEVQQIQDIFKRYQECVYTPSNPIGRFKLFQLGTSLMPGKNVAQPKRNIAWH